MMTQPVWWDYATYDKDGFVKGIRDDAPEDIKQAYEEYLKEESLRKEKRIKI